MSRVIVEFASGASTVPTLPTANAGACGTYTYAGTATVISTLAVSAKAPGTLTVACTTAGVCTQ